MSDQNGSLPRARGVLFVALLAAAILPCPRTVSAEKQAAALEARHHAGQTFLTWQEVDPPPGGAPSAEQVLKLRRQWRESGPKTLYRVYRSAKPIRSLEGLEPVAEIPPLSGFNADFYGADPRPADKALRYVVREGGEPLAPGLGLWVLNPKEAGEAYYAVTVVTDGKEERSLGPANALETPVRETVGQGVPVLQRIEKPKEFQYVEGPTLHYFVRWESPPNCAVPGRPFDYLLAVPPKPAKPAPVGIHLHCWGGSLRGGYGWWYNAQKGHVLAASNQAPYDWWTGYHEQFFDAPPDKERWRQGVVRPYSQTRMFSFVDWVATRCKVDPARTYAAGSSMGGSGAPMLAIRYPERIAWAVSWVGVHDPARSPQFAGSYARVFGEPDWGVRFEDGTPVWDYYSDAWYLRKHPEKEIGLITFSNGKNDGGIGWPQAVDFFRALQETRRPHVFVWGQAGHGERALMPLTLEERMLPIDVRVDQTLPAFTRGSLDDNPGKGDPADGDPKGQANLYLYWETADLVDEPDRWEMTVGVSPKCPKDEGAADLTPRRVQRFKLKPGQKVRWTNAAADGGRVMQQGEAAADPLGLVTLEQVRMTKAKNRVKIQMP